MMSDDNRGLSGDWPEAGQFRRSIRLEISLYISAILLAVMAVTGFVITDQYVDTVTQNITDKLLVQARSFSSPAGKHILSADEPDALLLNNICRKLIDDNPDVHWAGIAGTDNKYLAHTDLKEVIAGNEMVLPTGSQSFSGLRDGEHYSSSGDTLYITVPIEENSVRVGVLGVASSTDQIVAARMASITSVATITLLMLLIGVPFTMVLVRRKLRPIATITDRLKEVDLEHIRFDSPVKGRNEFGYLAETLRVMGDKLNIAQQDLVEKERVAREMEIAREIQTNILPRVYPRTSSFEFSGAYLSAREVGGDYYDFVDIDADHVGFLVADVSGKSLPGMLVMLLTRDIVIRLARTVFQPSELLTAVNRELLASIKKGMFVTMFFGVLDKGSGRFRFASAGHNPLVRLDAVTGEAELIKTKGYPLGMMTDSQFSKRIETGEINLSSGDWLVQYTDGINEAQNVGAEEYGMDRFVEVLREHQSETPEELAAGTIRRLEEFVGEAPQYDDITLLAMRWEGQAAMTKNEAMRATTSAG